ncbi:NAD(P)/FAD-dependent oxidoreductase [Povalibacter sp.]|uniref:flavin monoamine oxidase family protein n=1 Tax=Povalibacter sp. TaxID=1962978 RepID=UPI002F402C5E
MSEFDAVIVGAGSAGISAARHLAQAGRSTVVLEARDRVGGRAWTETATLGMPVDMGCAWLHSADRNPWTQYARANGFIVDERLPQWGAHVGRRRLSENEREELGAAIQQYDSILIDAAGQGIDVAVADLLPQGPYRARFDSIVTFLCGAESTRMSSLDFANYADSGTDWAVQGGLGALVAHAADALDVRLSTPVRQIDARGPRARVLTDAGIVDARTVIVTVPTSVLAAQTLRFLPLPPPSFLEAFAGIPLGANSKVFFRMAPGSLPFTEPTTFMAAQDSARVGSYQAWPGGVEAVQAFFGGDLARELERRGETEHYARDELTQMFGTQFTGAIQGSVTTSWMHDPWSMGSYSHALPGEAHRRQQLNEPLHGRIFLAGEACSVHASGTLHGARDSGISAAEKALAVLGTT